MIFQRLLDIMKKAFIEMSGYGNVEEVLAEEGLSTVSSVMEQAIQLWQDMYKNCPEWEDEETGVHSIGIPKQLCEVMATTMLDELEIRAIPEDYDVQSGKEIDEDSLSYYIQQSIDKHLRPKLEEKLEEGLAMGGVIIKPYVSNNTIYYDFVNQGDFYPIAFDNDDTRIVDVAFLDRFVEGSYLYSRVERQTFKDNTVTIRNRAFRAKYQKDTNDKDKQEIGIPVPLDSIDRWKDIEEETVIEDVKGPLFGYYKVAAANNIDLQSPLGVSFFAPASYLIMKADHQFSRLDWEYEGGQLAIDVDPTALLHKESYYGEKIEQAQGKQRIYRSLDLGQDDTYKPYSPTLRDNSFLNGLNAYKMEIEDRCALSRGSISNVETQAKTATELKILQKRIYNTADKNQKSLSTCIEDVINAAEAIISVYRDQGQVDLAAPEGDFELLIEWGDSILVDKDAELDNKIKLVEQGVMSKAELRAWYMDEPLEVAAEQIENIAELNRDNMSKDMATEIMTQMPGLEAPNQEDEEVEEKNEQPEEEPEQEE